MKSKDKEKDSSIGKSLYYEWKVGGFKSCLDQGRPS